MCIFSTTIVCNYNCNWLTQKTWSGLSPTRNPVHLRLWGLSFSVLGDMPNWDSGQTQSPSSLGPKVRIQTHESLKYAFWEGIETKVLGWVVPDPRLQTCQPRPRAGRPKAWVGSDLTKALPRFSTWFIILYSYSRCVCIISNWPVYWEHNIPGSLYM